MLRAKFRFHSRGGVNAVRSQGETLRTAYFSVNFMPNTYGFRRFAVIVSKKVEKTAVGRNRLRRRFFEAIRLEFPLNTPKYDYVFSLYSRHLATMPFDELRKLVRSTFTHIHEDPHEE